MAAVKATTRTVVFSASAARVAGDCPFCACEAAEALCAAVSCPMAGAAKETGTTPPCGLPGSPAGSLLQPAKSAAMHSSSPENVAPRKTPVMLFFFLYSILSLFLFIIE